MKRFTYFSIVLLLAAAANTTVQAQKSDTAISRKERKEFQKQLKAAELTSVIDSLVLNRCFNFGAYFARGVDNSYSKSGILDNAPGLMVFPDRYPVGTLTAKGGPSMGSGNLRPTSRPPGGYYSNVRWLEGRDPYTSLEQKGDKWYIEIAIEYLEGAGSYELIVDRKTGKATLYEIIPRQSGKITSRGMIYSR